MNIVKKDVDALNATITVNVTPEDYSEVVDKKLKEHQKKAELKGFRKGKAPLAMIKKLYGTSILVEEINRLVTNSLYRYIVDNNLDILGEPLPNEEEQSEIDWKNTTDFSFVYDVGISPNIDLNLSKEDKITRYVIDVSETTLDKGVEMHASRFGQNEGVDEVAEKDLLRGNLVEMSGETPSEDGIDKEDVAISLEYMKDEEIKQQFIGAKKGDEIVFDLKKAYPNVADLASLLEVEKEIVENLESNFRFTINEISRYIPHPLNQELFDKVFGEGTVKDEKEFREKVKEEISKQLEKNTEYKLNIDLKTMLLDNIKFDLPETFLKKWLVLSDEKLTKEIVEENSEGYLSELRWQLIKAKVAKQYEITVSEEEVKETAKMVALEQFRMYGMMEVPDEHLENYAQELMKNKEQYQKIHLQKEEQKIYASIATEITLEDKSISEEDFNKLFE